jgi:hypothetical protein
MAVFDVVRASMAPIAVRAGEAVEIRWELTGKGLEHEVTV